MFRNITKLLPILSSNMRSCTSRIPAFIEMTKSNRANFVIIKNKNPDNDNPTGNPFRDFNKGRENDRDSDPSQNRNKSQQDDVLNTNYPVNERAGDSANRMSSRPSHEKTQNSENRRNDNQRQESNPNEKVFNTENTQRPRSREDYQRNTAGRVDGPDDLGLKRSSEDETNLNSRPADELKSGSEGSRLTSNKMNWNDIQNKNQFPPKGDIGDQKRGYIDTEDKGMKGSWENENRLDLSAEGKDHGYNTGKNQQQQSKRGFSTLNKKSDQNQNKDKDQQFKEQAKQEEKNKFDTSKAQDGWAQGASGNQYQSTRGYSAKPSSEDQNIKAGSGQSEQNQGQNQNQNRESRDKNFVQQEKDFSKNLDTERRTSSQSKEVGDNQFRQHERDAADVNRANQNQQKKESSGSQTMATEEERGEQTWTTGGQMNVKDPRKGLERDQSQQKQQTMGEGMRTETGGYEQRANKQRAAQERGHEKQAGIDSSKDQSSGKQEKTVSGSGGSEADEEFFVTEMLVVSSNVDWEGLKRGQKPVILDFYKKGHEGSKRLHPKLAEKAKSNKGKWVFAGCDLEKDMVKSLVRDLNVSSAPTVMLFFEGKVVEQFTGHDEHKLDKIVKKAEELSSK